MPNTTQETVAWNLRDTQTLNLRKIAMKSLFEKERPWKNDHEAIEMEQKRFFKKWVQPYAFVLIFFCIGLGIFTPYRLTLVMGLVLLLALLSKRYAAVTGKGLEQMSNLLLFTNHRIVPWEKIDTITYEKLKEHPEITILYFTLGDLTRRALFPTSERNRILRLAQKYVPDVKIYDGAAFKEKTIQKDAKSKSKQK